MRFAPETELYEPEYLTAEEISDYDNSDDDYYDDDYDEDEFSEEEEAPPVVVVQSTYVPPPAVTSPARSTEYSEDSYASERTEQSRPQSGRRAMKKGDTMARLESGRAHAEESPPSSPRSNGSGAESSNTSIATLANLDELKTSPMVPRDAISSPAPRSQAAMDGDRAIYVSLWHDSALCKLRPRRKRSPRCLMTKNARSPQLMRWCHHSSN